VVVTTFSKAYPLVRFGTGDLSAVLPGISPCGRTNMRIKGWMGRADQQDVMTLKAELIGGSTDLAKAVEGNIQNICKVRGRVEFVAPGSLPNDGKVIDDVRKYT
jgi:phenylacetate-CoA ligase